MALWRLDDGTGTQAVDASPNGNDGTFMGDPEWVEGVHGTALMFDGDGDYVDFGSGSVFDITEQITLALWVNANDMGNSQHNMWLGKGDNAYAIKHQSGNNVEFFIYDGDWNSINYATGLEDLGGEWHHMAGTFDGEELLLYVDGEAVQSLALATTINIASHAVTLAENSQATGRYFDGMLDDARIYNRALTAAEIAVVMEGGGNAGLASSPLPEDESIDVPPATDLSWSAGEFAQTHDVYLGTDWEDVNTASVDNPLGVLTAEGLTEATLVLDPLAFETAYFWRVDEVNSPPDKTIFKGEIWSFTTEPVGYPVPDVSATASSVHQDTMEPVNTVNGSGLNADDEHSTDLAHMWLSNAAETEGVWVQYDLGKVYKLDRFHMWNHNTQTEMILGYGIKEALIETSTDGETWSELKTPTFAQATGLGTYTGTPTPLDGAMAQYVRITALSNYSVLGLKQFGLGEVRFYYIPVQAREPIPADNGTSDGADVLLQWRAGREAVQHEVVFSADRQAVDDGSAVVGTVDNPSFDLGTLDLGHTYYWKINEMNDLGTPPVYEGDLWTFQTPDQFMIDDFERYQAKEGLFIWEHWVDGFENPNDNGAVVGNGDDPETTEVYEGSQSMPLTYNNTAAPKSEATRTFDPPLDLAAGNPASIEVYVKGIPYVVVGSYSVDGNSWTDLEWNPRVELGEDIYIGMAVTSHDIASVATATIDSVSSTGTVTGDWTQADIGGTHPDENFTEVNGTFTIKAMGGDIWGTADEFRYVYKQLSGAGSLTAKVESLDGTNAWCKAGVMLRDALTPDSSHAFMAATGTNGIHLQGRMSHGASSTQDADHGDLDGTQEIMEKPVWVRIERKIGNSAAPIYMTLTDTAGKSATVETEADATTVGSWTLLSAVSDDLSVNLSQIESITIGVSGAGAEGIIYVDAIRTFRPYPTSDLPAQ